MSGFVRRRYQIDPQALIDTFDFAHSPMQSPGAEAEIETAGAK